MSTNIVAKCDPPRQNQQKGDDSVRRSLLIKILFCLILHGSIQQKNVTVQNNTL